MPPALVLAFALLGISFAAPLVRLSGADPLVVAAWRVGLSLLVVAAFVVPTRGWRQWARLGRRDLALALGAGVMLALHFWAWNASVKFTSIAASVVLVNLQPAFVAAISAVWLRERATRRQIAGIAIAIVGVFVVAAGDVGGGAAGTGSRALLGDALALVGAVTVAIYYSSGRRLRQQLDLWPYVALVYGACLVTLLLIALVAGVPLGPQPPRELAIFAGLALGPMLLGHTGMNWALRRLPAYVVALTTLGEPVGATLLGWLLPGIGEVPSGTTLLGGTIILAGILVTSARRAPVASRPGASRPGASPPAPGAGPGERSGAPTEG